MMNWETMVPTQIKIAITVVLVSFSLAASAQGQIAASAPLDCSIGPVKRTYGDAEWLVYSCSDRRSVVLMSAPGSRAAPFYFVFGATANGHHLVGEGAGDKAVTDRAFEQLKALSESQIDLLVTETRAQRLQ